jgi:hypothetical protein
MLSPCQDNVNGRTPQAPENQEENVPEWELIGENLWCDAVSTAPEGSGMDPTDGMSFDEIRHLPLPTGENRTPGEAATHGFHHHQIAFLELVFFEGMVQRQRN